MSMLLTFVVFVGQASHLTLLAFSMWLCGVCVYIFFFTIVQVCMFALCVFMFECELCVLWSWPFWSSVCRLRVPISACNIHRPHQAHNHSKTLRVTCNRCSVCFFFLLQPLCSYGVAISFVFGCCYSCRLCVGMCVFCCFNAFGWVLLTWLNSFV